MNLGHIERGTKMTIFEDFQQRAVSDEFDAVFRYLEKDKVFIVQSSGLYSHFDRLHLGSKLNVSFRVDPNTYRFSGRPMEKQKGSNQVLIEQISDIQTMNPRQYDRDELRFTVKVYGLPESKLAGTKFERPVTEPELADVTYDVSAGGLCVISNTLLSSKYDPYYLLLFDISPRDSFVLPAKIVRRSNYPRTKIGKYDYGFQFVFDKLPDEKSRLTRSILSKKLSQR